MEFIKRSVIIAVVGVIVFCITPSQVAADYVVNPYWFRIIGGRPNSDVVILERVLEKQNVSYYSKLRIPVIHGVADKELYEQLNTMFLEGISHFEEEIESNSIKALKQLQLADQQLPDYVTDVNYQVNYNSGGLLSVTVCFFHHVDESREMSFMESVNVDLTTGRIIEFNDLFATAEERNLLISAINEQIKSNSAAYFVEKIDESYLPLIQSFYVKENAIVVYFDLNDLGPYTIGIPEFSFELTRAVNELRQNN